MKIKCLIPILLAVLVFSLIGCSSIIKTINKATTKNTIIETTTETAATDTTAITTAENTAVETTTIDMDKVKFWEVIVDGEKSYDITDKVLDYPMKEINILSDVVDGKIGINEEITRFWELANQVQKDFMLVDLIIGGSLKQKGVTQTDDMTEVITLIKDWADNMENSYSYYAKYLDTEQAEYDFKVDECKEEADKIHEEYLEKRYPYVKEYNTYYNIK